MRIVWLKLAIVCLYDSFYWPRWGTLAGPVLVQNAHWQWQAMLPVYLLAGSNRASTNLPLYLHACLLIGRCVR